jgi:ABC-2 type transport system permease protein
MSLDTGRVWTVARREFLATVRRKAFVLTLIGTPFYFVFMMSITTGSSINAARKSISQLKAFGVVDSSGLLANAEHTMRSSVRGSDNPFQRQVPGAGEAEQVFSTDVRFYPDAPAAQNAIRAEEIGQAIIVPADYLQTGHVRRYVRSAGLFSESADRAVSRWLAANLVRGKVEPELAARVARPLADETTFKLDKSGEFVAKSDNDELGGVFIPMMFALALGLCITIGGQYLVQGVVEEKESRILESLLCTIQPAELMAGKLFGLGAVGLLVIAVWGGAGLVVGLPALAAMHIQLPAFILPVAVAYFLLGYLFYGSLMLGIGAVTNNMREAQQFSVWFSFANFAPLIVLWMVISNPNGLAPTLLSMFPPTAATGMMLRMSAPGSVVPAWQIGLSIALLALSAWFSLMVAARIFRIGLLMHGKTPTLPEILRWARQG